MAKMTGMQVKVYVKDALTGLILAGQRNASLKRSVSTIDSTSKDTTDGYKEVIPGFKEWGVDCDGAYVESDAAYGKLEDAYVAGTNVDLEIHFPSGTVYSGNAAIKDFSLDLPYDSLVTYKLSFDGSGALTKTTTP